MEEIHECQEAYQACVAARKARVEAVLKTAELWETESDLAEKAAVALPTIQRAKAALLQTTSGDGVCNSPPLTPLKLRDLYMRDNSTLVSLGFRKTVSAAESALGRCSRLEQAYFICEIIPEFRKDLEVWLSRRKENDIVKFKYIDPEAPADAEENHAAHGAV